MSNGLPDFVGATVETVFTFAGQELAAPIAGLAASSLAAYLSDRYHAAKSILLSELQRAGASAADFRDAQEFAAAAFRYTRAARDQTADENLRLLAQAMIGLARRERLWASDFLKYADILSSLSREEIIVIGKLMAADAEAHSPEDNAGQSHVWLKVKQQLLDHNNSDRFLSEEYLETIAKRGQRSGLIMPAGTWARGYYLSPIGRQVREFVDIEAALNPHMR